MLCLFVLVLRLVSYVIGLNARESYINHQITRLVFYQMKTKKSREKGSRLFPALCMNACVDMVTRCNCFGVVLMKRIRKIDS